MHFEKYQGCAVSGVTKHNERLWEGRGFERENIDNARIGEDYNLAPDRGDPVGFVNDRIAALELKRAPRKDAVRMVEWVATMPEGETDERGFFESLYRHMAKTYGEENVVGAWVHKDEPGARPHMHFDFVPVTKDGRLSAKEIMSRAHLRTIHQDMQKAVSEDLGHEVRLLLPEEEKGQKELSRLDNADYVAAMKAKEKAEADLLAARDEKRQADEDRAAAESERDALRVEVESLGAAVEDARLDLADARDEAAEERERLELVRRSRAEAEERASLLGDEIAAARQRGSGVVGAFDRALEQADGVLGGAKDLVGECEAAVSGSLKGRGVPECADSRGRENAARAGIDALGDRIAAVRERLGDLRQRFVEAARDFGRGWGLLSKRGQEIAQKEVRDRRRGRRVADVLRAARAASAAQRGVRDREGVRGRVRGAR